MKYRYLCNLVLYNSYLEFTRCYYIWILEYVLFFISGILSSQEVKSDFTSKDHRQSKEWTGNAGKIANVADATSVIRADTLYFGTLYLHFKCISRLCIYKF